MIGFCPDRHCVLGTTLAEIQVVDGRTIPVYEYCEHCNPDHLDEDQWAADHQEETQPDLDEAGWELIPDQEIQP